jgi:hypothetical protein
MVSLYELVSHTPFILSVRASSLQTLYGAVIRALFELRGPRINDEVVARMAATGIVAFQRSVIMESSDIQHLLAEFITEALYLADLYEEAYCNATFHSCNETRIKARLHGVPVTGFDDGRSFTVRPQDILITQTDNEYRAEIAFQTSSVQTSSH